MTEYGVDFSISHFRSTHLVGGCSFYTSNITCLSCFFKKKIFSITIPYSWKYTSCTFLSYSRSTVFISISSLFIYPSSSSWETLQLTIYIPPYLYISLFYQHPSVHLFTKIFISLHNFSTFGRKPGV